MGDSGDGWHTVMPTSHSAVERLPRAQLEAYEKQVLRELDATRGHWSGIGKHTPANDFSEAKKLQFRFKPAPDKILGSGSYGVVEKVHFFHNNRTVCLARKHIQRNRRVTIQKLREEANVMEKLDHEHIVKLVGTYCVRPHELFILLWPVAVCNLDSLFNDLDCLREGQGDRDDIISRLQALELDNLSAVEHRRPLPYAGTGEGNCPLKYLQQITGCITRAVAYCHGQNIRHLDLKPSNILLNAGRVYLADFGIAKDVNDRDHTMTLGQQGTLKWRAPEIYQIETEWSMRAADVYSLGLVLLNIATILYGATMADFDAVVGDLSPRGRAEKLRQYHIKLEPMALATQEVEDVNAPTFAPKHIIGLTSNMLSLDPSARPVVDQVDTELVELGGIDQIYHSPCCKKRSRFVTDRMSTRYKQAVEERNRLRIEYGDLAKRLEVLERKDETYESRIQNERRAHADKIAALQEQLDKERAERRKLEGHVAEIQGRRPPRPSIPRPGSDRSIPGSSPSPGLTMRAKPPTHLIPKTTPPLPSPSPSPLPQPLQRIRTPTVTFNPRLTYSQTVATAGTPRDLPSVSAQPSDAIVSSSVTTSGPIPASEGTPSPDPVGFPLRSRNSGSRLPRAVNPATPIRSNTPTLNRDPSSTDSTQYSMASSTFSRRSSMPLKYADSTAKTSVAGTPALGSPAVNDFATRGIDSNGNPSSVRPERDAVPHIGLGIIERRESVTTEGQSVRDTASVVSSVAVPGTSSPMFGGSALSSPRAAHAELDGSFKVPSLPTAKSWADVAKRQRRG
ncbi:kinase-like domain-containing protein [Lasiosphaeria ovina]|uniref:Kinase-like domain-containing protein n=1 Tax=Lasiosphaeria ovina TaxID=92902 RepID=A0AAE0JTP8_9PEZI|nr:kinase-like domain-containing protein [Lasiosphaeria ovina]